MVKKLEDYKNKGFQIHITKKEDYEALIPQLNTIWKGWTKGIWNYERNRQHMYIYMSSDSCESYPSTHYEIIEVSEFLEPKDEIINSYPIY